MILWDTVDFLPEPMVEPLFAKLHEVMTPGGLMLAFFHASNDPSTVFCRYHLTDSEVVEIQKAGSFPLLSTYSNRKVETLLRDFSNYRFFLAKDSLREVIVTR